MIDLHTHTNYSDGTDSVTELLKHAEEKKLEILSITDHDEIGAYLELEQHPEIRQLFSGKIIVGAELKAVYQTIPVEILAYGFDYSKLQIHKIDNEKIQKECLTHFISVLKKYGFHYDEKELYIDRKNPSKQWASFVIAKELLEHEENQPLIQQIGGFTPTTFYRDQECNQNSIFYFDEGKYNLDINEIINSIHEAGGLAFLAHPFLYPFAEKEKTIEEIIKTFPLDGIECIYPLFSQEQRDFLITLSHKYHKYQSGGTDYHAQNKPNILLGTGIQNNIEISSTTIQDWIFKLNHII